MVSNAAFEQAVLDALAALRADFVAIKNDVAAIKTDVAAIKTDVAGLKTDVAGLKTDVAGLKTDVTGLKADNTSLKAEVMALNVRVDRLERETFAQFTSLAREIQLLRHEFESFRISVSMQLSAHDSNFRDITMTLRELWTVYSSTTHIIDMRITALEQGS